MQLKPFFVVLVSVVNLVTSDPILFQQGWIKYVKRGKRTPVFDVQYIDEKIIDPEKQVLLIKTKLMQTVYSQAVRNLKNLQNLSMAKCGILDIQANAFHNLPNLTVLHLHDNQLETINSGVFNKLSIKILTLQRNFIKEIKGDAFDDIPNLYKIKLNSNLLTSWDANWFQNSPQLTEIYLRRNRLKELQAYAFKNIKARHLINGENVIDTKIYLSKNKLGKITPESFYNLTELSQLWLDRNNISEIPEQAFRDLEKIDVLYLTRNKIGEIKDNSFPSLKSVGILDLTVNMLKCLPYQLVSVANLTYLERNNVTCKCVVEYNAKLVQEKRKCHINYGGICIK